jgi:peptidoglycan/xylan/chitin deacetylase (PgdA/CDA1 family)
MSGRRRGAAIAAVGLAALVAAAPAQAYRGPVPILTYHVLRAAPPAARFPASATLWVPRARFDAQLEALARAGYHGVTLSQAWAAWHGGRALPDKPVVVSFDDGYATQYTVAGPELRKLGWPGVLNLWTGRLTARGGLTVPQVRTLLRQGWELASHSLTHPDLTKVGAARLAREVSGSRSALRRLFSVGVRFFCYPYGRTDAAASAAVRRAGYTAATTAHHGIAGPRTNRFALPRIGVGPADTPARLLRRLRG